MLKNRKSDLPDFGGTIVLHKECAQSVLKRMGFTKRRAWSKTKVIPKDFVEIQRQYLSDIMAAVLMEEVPHQQIINWYHTDMKVIPAMSWMMERKGTNRVEISGIDDKHPL